jgi:riboflavin kinase / FMN adenylyltransferase
VLRWRGVENTPSDWYGCVVTIGVFDGVHRGHRQIIGRAVERARDTGQPAVVLTFDPHPSEVVRPGSHPAVLTPPRFKAELLEQIGVDVLCVQPFTLDFSRLAPNEFVHKVLLDHLHANAIVIGDNFHYGHKAAGDVASLQATGNAFGFSVEGVSLLRDTDVLLSSTHIRNCIARGDVEVAARELGRDHRIEGYVIRGDNRGHTIGYPTANLETVPYAAVPADGVYAGRAIRGGRRYRAAISIGTNPTFAGRERRVEAYLLDFDGDLYGEYLGLEFTARLRPTLKFDSVEDLVAQMAKDVEETRQRVRIG